MLKKDLQMMTKIVSSSWKARIITLEHEWETRMFWNDSIFIDIEMLFETSYWEKLAVQLDEILQEDLEIKSTKIQDNIQEALDSIDLENQKSFKDFVNYNSDFLSIPWSNYWIGINTIKFFEKKFKDHYLSVYQEWEHFFIFIEWAWDLKVLLWYIRWIQIVIQQTLL